MHVCSSTSCRRAVLECSCGLERLRKLHVDLLTSLHVRDPPDELLHRILRLYPRTTCRAPSWRTCHRHLETERVSESCSVCKCILPVVMHVDEPLLNDCRRAESRVEMVESSDARTVHPFEVFLDSVFCDVSVHPMPPHACACFIRRVVESCFKNCKRFLRLLFGVSVGAA